MESCLNIINILLKKIKKDLDWSFFFLIADLSINIKYDIIKIQKE